ncbi:MAG: hypothetical protein IPN01_03120 [Deltaproteobacteria bacterium]|nr:hypothetical protein [Deltaproteobacteria bacterium]MBK9365303.1 hypothetical protein [Deltaproteobacteria bacterium]
MPEAPRLKAVCTGSQPIPKGARLSGAATLGADRAIVLLSRAGAPDQFVIMDRRSPETTTLAEGDCEGWVCLFDEGTNRVVIGLDRRILVFDGSSLAQIGELAPAPRRAMGELALGGRAVITGSDASWTLWDLRTLAVLAKDDQRAVKHWWVGPEATDPPILLRSAVQDGRWRTWTERADTQVTQRAAVVRVREPCETSAALLPGGDGWVGVVTEGQDDTWGPSRLIRFTAQGPEELLSLAPVRDFPSMLRLLVLTPEHVYIQGGGHHGLVHLPTATLSPCPQDHLVSASGMTLSRDGEAFDPWSRGLAKLHRPKVRHAVAMALSEDGHSALVTTTRALTWWSIRR